MAKAGDEFVRPNGERLTLCLTSKETNGELLEMEVVYSPNSPRHQHITTPPSKNISKPSTARYMLKLEGSDVRIKPATASPFRLGHTTGCTIPARNLGRLSGRYDRR